MSLGQCCVRWTGHSAVITLPAGIDVINVGQVSDLLLQTLNAGPAVLIADMTGTSYCAAAGVHALIYADCRADAAGIGLRVAVSIPIVRRVLELTGATQFLDTYPDLDTALATVPVAADSNSAVPTDGYQIAAGPAA